MLVPCRPCAMAMALALAMAMVMAGIWLWPVGYSHALGDGETCAHSDPHSPSPSPSEEPESRIVGGRSERRSGEEAVATPLAPRGRPVPRLVLCSSASDFSTAVDASTLDRRLCAEVWTPFRTSPALPRLTSVRFIAVPARPIGQVSAHRCWPWPGTCTSIRRRAPEAASCMRAAQLTCPWRRPGSLSGHGADLLRPCLRHAWTLRYA